ncbi:MAG: hypothetical protein RMM98_14510 [Acidobacteriota bacterium]|nr:hypothetical protein [Blastocatellia bacterium]MDW8240818.1 hypothetical protein [Acidobacteriota bacterium]
MITLAQIQPEQLDRDRPARLKWYHWVGLALVATCWPLNWMLTGLRTHVLFFPLWLGYILVVDGLVYRRRGTSLVTRSPREFALLFALSAPMWWLFELINWRTQNWEYLGSRLYTDAAHFLLATLSFSTVIPAVLVTTELARTFRWIERFASRSPVAITPQVSRNVFIVGAAMLTLLLAFPRYCYPFVWTSLVCLIEPINRWLGRHALLNDIQRGDWRTVVSLATGVLICGFFWEMWNYFSYPKWIYHVPFFGFWRVFEMPLLGYLGYIPFAWELHGIVRFARPRLALNI